MIIWAYDYLGRIVLVCGLLVILVAIVVLILKRKSKRKQFSEPVEKNKVAGIIMANPQIPYETMRVQALEVGISETEFEKAWKETHKGKMNPKTKIIILIVLIGILAIAAYLFNRGSLSYPLSKGGSVLCFAYKTGEECERHPECVASYMDNMGYGPTRLGECRAIPDDVMKIGLRKKGLCEKTGGRWDGNFEYGQCRAIETDQKYLDGTDLFIDGVGMQSEKSICESIHGKWVPAKRGYFSEDTKKQCDSIKNAIWHQGKQSCLIYDENKGSWIGSPKCIRLGEVVNLQLEINNPSKLDSLQKMEEPGGEINESDDIKFGKIQDQLYDLSVSTHYETKSSTECLRLAEGEISKYVDDHRLDYMIFGVDETDYSMEAECTVSYLGFKGKGAFKAMVKFSPEDKIASIDLSSLEAAEVYQKLFPQLSPSIIKPLDFHEIMEIAKKRTDFNSDLKALSKSYGSVRFDEKRSKYIWSLLLILGEDKVGIRAPRRTYLFDALSGEYIQTEKG